MLSFPGLLALQLYFAASLGVAGLSKLRFPQHFEHAVGQARIMPRSLIRPLRYALALAEIVLGAALVLGAFSRFVSVSVLMLFTLFLFFQTWLFLRGRFQECGCFPTTAGKEGKSALLRSATLWLMALLLVMAASQSTEWQKPLRILLIMAYGGAIGWLSHRAFRLSPARGSTFKTNGPSSPAQD